MDKSLKWAQIGGTFLVKESYEIKVGQKYLEKDKIQKQI
jgi:hypothetical protein